MIVRHYRPNGIVETWLTSSQPGAWGVDHRDEVPTFPLVLAGLMDADKADGARWTIMFTRDELAAIVTQAARLGIHEQKRVH